MTASNNIRAHRPQIDRMEAESISFLGCLSTGGSWATRRTYVRWINEHVTALSLRHGPLTKNNGWSGKNVEIGCEIHDWKTTEEVLEAI
ncbi:hypothetical protein OC845_006029, partial [Tilletia horrida]